MTFGRYTLAPGPEWTSIAARWPLVLVSRETEPGHWLTDVIHPDLEGEHLLQFHLVCDVAGCGQSVACLDPGTSPAGYQVTAEMITSGTLRHIRQCHEDTVTI